MKWLFKENVIQLENISLKFDIFLNTKLKYDLQSYNFALSLTGGKPQVLNSRPLPTSGHNCLHSTLVQVSLYSMACVTIVSAERHLGKSLGAKSHNIKMSKAERLYQLERPPFTSVSVKVSNAYFCHYSVVCLPISSRFFLLNLSALQNANVFIYRENSTRSLQISWVL